MNIDPQKTKIEQNVRHVRHLLMYFEDKYGIEELKNFINKTGMPLEYFNDENNWISYEYWCDLLKTLADYTNDPNIAFNFVVLSAKEYGKKSWGTIITILLSFMSCMYAYKKLVAISPTFMKAGRLILLFINKNKAIIEFKLLNGLKMDKHDCLNTQGNFAGLPLLLNLPQANVKETQCAAKGSESCIYEVTWINRPYKKTRYFATIAGIIIAILFFFSEKWLVTDIRLLFIISLTILPIIIYLLWNNQYYHKKQADNFKTTEEQNNILTDYLLEFEKLNKQLQKKVEKRTNELQISNKELNTTLSELQTNESQLIKSEKMAAVGMLAGEMANELNNPVDLIARNIQNVIEGVNKEDQFYDRLIETKIITTRCKKIITELLSFSNNNSNLHLSDVDINKIINSTIKKVNEEIPDLNIKITKKINGNLPPVKADNMQLQQVFMAIIKNALDSIQERIKKGNKAEGKISIDTTFDENNIQIIISDTGTGISKEIADKIFDPFFTTKPSGKGKGIGLTLCYNIIKRFNGDIQVNSNMDVGTDFSIKFPISGNVIG